MNNLEKYGAKEYFTSQGLQYSELNLARVISQHKKLYSIITSKGECLAEVSGKFRFEINNISDFPVVGDFVIYDDCDGDNRYALIKNILKRKNKFERVAVGNSNQTQIIASNIDIIFICMSLNNDYNLSRLERIKRLIRVSETNLDLNAG